MVCAAQSGMTPSELRARVKRFAIRVVKFVRSLSRDLATREIGYQLLKSGTGESANYHAACRGRSRAEFIAKLGTAVEEADETEHWLDVMKQGDLASGAELEWLILEAAELRAILKKSLKTSRTNYERQKEQKARRSERSVRPRKIPKSSKFSNP